MSGAQISLDEAQRARRALETAIRVAINEYQDHHGLTVDAVDLEHAPVQIAGERARRRLLDVQLRVML